MLACGGPVSEFDDLETSEFATATSSISNGFVSYSPGLVRIDRDKNRNGVVDSRCSGFFIAPNMIATSAHCVDDITLPGIGGTRDGMRWGHVRVRIVYKPASNESMCINEPCRNANGTQRFTTVRAWWDAGYSGDGDTASDMAVLTRVQGLDFPTRPSDMGGAAPRALSDARRDFYRILDGRTSLGTVLNVYGYGRYTDTQVDMLPRWGQLYADWWGGYHVVSDAGRDARGCAGDSGGPLSYRHGVFDPPYAIGAFSNTDSRNGACPERGDKMRWTRLDPKRWMFNAIMDWADISGRPFCRRYSKSNFVGDGGYYRCW